MQEATTYETNSNTSEDTNRLDPTGSGYRHIRKKPYPNQEGQRPNTQGTILKQKARTIEQSNITQTDEMEVEDTQ
ncbi:2130_t:CDS:2, partial [Gigaspora margarita]